MLDRSLPARSGRRQSVECCTLDLLDARMRRIRGAGWRAIAGLRSHCRTRAVERRPPPNSRGTCARRGDEAVLEYTRRSTASAAARCRALELPQAELEPRSTGCLRRAQRGAGAGGRAHPRLSRTPAGCESWTYTDDDGTVLGQQVTPLDRVGLYVPGGKAAYPSSVLMNAMPAKVAGVGELIMVVPTPDGEKNQLVLAAAAICRRGPRVHHRRRAGRRRAGLRHGHRAAGRQDRRARQRLCGRGQAPRVRRGRHRHDRGPVRDPGHLRRQDRPGLGRDGPVLAGRARRAGPGDPAVAGRGLHRRGGRQHRPAAAADAARRHDRAPR